MSGKLSNSVRLLVVRGEDVISLMMSFKYQGCPARKKTLAQHALLYRKKLCQLMWYSLMEKYDERF